MELSAEDVNNALDILSKVDSTFFKGDENARQKVLAKSRALTRRLELPGDAIVREIWMQPMESVAIKFGQDVQLFSKLSRDGDGQSLEELSRMTNTSSDLLLRFLKLLCSADIVERTRNNRYRGTVRSEGFTSPGAFGGMSHLFTQVWPCFSALPEFLQKTGYQTPTDVTRGPWQHGLKTSDAFFDWLQKRPTESEGFQNLMAMRSTPYKWTDVFPVSTLAENPPDSETPLVVDIGGGLGADLLYLRDALHPERYRLEVQDLEEVVEQGRQQGQDVGIGFRVHNFFDAQPVVGAKAYFMHSILHDWPDVQAVTILRNIRPAMKVGYSKLLLCEAVNPLNGRYHMTNTMDIVMMGLLCAKERTEPEWEKLLKDAGFMLRKIWHHRYRAISVIEAIPVQHSRI